MQQTHSLTASPFFYCECFPVCAYLPAHLFLLVCFLETGSLHCLDLTREPRTLCLWLPRAVITCTMGSMLYLVGELPPGPHV